MKTVMLQLHCYGINCLFLTSHDSEPSTCIAMCPFPDSNNIGEKVEFGGCWLVSDLEVLPLAEL